MTKNLGSGTNFLVQILDLSLLAKPVYVSMKQEQK